MFGLQLPVIPLSDRVGRAGGTELKHSGPTSSNVGAIAFVILTEMVTGEPHCPPFGVNIYGDLPSVAVLIVEGLQVPVIPLFDVVGNEGGVEVWHISAITSNVGVIWVDTSISIVVGVPHWLPVG